MNEDGIRPARFMASGDRSRLPPAGAPVAELAFCLPDLPDVRDFVTAQALRGGMSEGGLADFLVAVNEVATNAVTHGHPTAKAVLRMWAVGRRIVVEIHDDPAALAEAVLRLLDDPELGARLGAAARAWAAKNLDMTVMVEEHIALYRRLLEARCAE